MKMACASCRTTTFKLACKIKINRSFAATSYCAGPGEYVSPRRGEVQVRGRSACLLGAAQQRVLIAYQYFTSNMTPVQIIIVDQ